MEPRMDYGKALPEALRAMYGLEGFVRRSGIEHSLLHLAKMRASQINGCAYCIDMHSKDARAGHVPDAVFLRCGRSSAKRN